MNQQRIQSAIDWLHQHQSTMLDELIALCNLNSASENLSGLLTTADHLIDLFGVLERPCRRHSLPPRSWTDDLGEKQEAPAGPVLEWRSEAGVGKRVLLAIHYDTVYPLTHPLQRCELIDSERLRGPGVIDAKGGIIVLKWAVQAAIRFELIPDLQWGVVLNPDEEIGSPSSSGFWKQISSDYDFAMLYEPAMADGCLVDSRKGSGNFLWVLRGRSAHSGRNFQFGRNAIVRASQLATKLHALNGLREGVTLNVGRIHGGGPLNVVPDLCTVRVNVRVENGEQMTWVEERWEEIHRELAREAPDFTFTFEGGLTSPPKVRDPSTLSWMHEVEAAAKSIGQTVRWKGSGGASDGNKLAALGLPNIDTFGPEGDGLHSPEEWLRIASLPQKASLTLAMLHRIASL